MPNRSIIRLLSGLTVIALWAVDCRDSLDPERHRPRNPDFALDQQNSAFDQRGTVIAKGFNPTNPHLHDAIVATFYWVGTTNIIREVIDLLADGTPVGNKYNLVDFVTADGISMATFLATDVQNFPDPCCGSDQLKILVVQANLTASVTDGGVTLAAFTGVNAVPADALGDHKFASGTGSSQTVADPGTIAISGAGVHAYAVTMANAVVGVAPPADFTMISQPSNTVMKADVEFAIRNAAGSVDPQWTWFFDSPGSPCTATSPCTWLAMVLALNPTPPPPVATHLAFIVQPSNTTAGSTISPAVQVAAKDDRENTVASFSGTVSVALGTNPGGGTLSGTKSVTALSGVATFSDLSIDKVGSGYTLVAAATAAGLTGATSAPFDITASPSVAPNDFMTGGGKLGEGRDFATLGFEARPTGRKVKLVQHCLRGANPESPTCRDGQFTFDGTITAGSYAAVSGQRSCRTWTGSGTRTNKDRPSASGTFAFTMNLACDNGEPGHGADFVDITIGGFHGSGSLSGGNVQLHKGR
jgi:hypothetical protein